MVRGLNPGGGEIFRTRIDGPSYIIGTGFFLRVKRPERGVDTHPYISPTSRKE
jgi:hypothetical protein